MTYYAPKRRVMPQPPRAIRRSELLGPIEKNGGPEGLDLRDACLVGDGPSPWPWENPIDLSPEALKREYDTRCGGRGHAPWLGQDGGIRLTRAQLQGAALNRANLQQADLIETELELAYLGEANLQNAFLQRAHLEGASLHKTDLRGGQLTQAHLEHADLGEAKLEGASTSLYEAHLQDANLHRAQMQRASLYGAELQGAILSGAQLQGADLQKAQLQGAHLSGAQFQEASLGGAHLERVDLYDVASLDGAHWYGANLDHTRIKGESLGKAVGDEIEAHKEKKPEAYHRAKEAYLLLKNNFNQIGRYEDASWAYVKEQQMEKMAYHWEWRTHGWKVWRAWGSFWRWLRNWAYELATGYGERPWNPIVVGLLAVLAFAGGFCATRAVANFWDALVYSVATFATFNLARLEPQGRGTEISSSMEAILGISVLALVVFTLGNRMSRG
jgi:uncharacterized protein YjbI with pentapeptide repeats